MRRKMREGPAFAPLHVLNQLETVMDHNAFLVWWLLGIPIVLAIVDLTMIGKSGVPRAGVADGYVARVDRRPAVGTADGVAATRPL